MTETVDLREILTIFFKGKWVIIICTIVALLLSTIVSWFLLEEKYESKAVIQVSSGLQDVGIMSNYVATEFTPLVYMQRMQNVEQNKKFFKENGIEDFEKKNLTISNGVNTNLVEVTYLAKTAEDAQNHLKLLINKTKNEVSSSMKETLNQLEQTYLKESDSLSSEINQLMNKYNNIIISNNLPEVLILQTISSSQFVLNLANSQNEDLSNISGQIQNELLQLKVQIETKSKEYGLVLENYQSVKTGLESFKPDPYIRTIVDPTLEVDPVSPNKVFNLAISLVLGLMIGIGIVYFRHYWKMTSNSN